MKTGTLNQRRELFSRWLPSGSQVTFTSWRGTKTLNLPKSRNRARPCTHPRLRPRRSSAWSLPPSCRSEPSADISLSSAAVDLEMVSDGMTCPLVCVSARSRAGSPPCAHVWVGVRVCVCALLCMLLIKRRSGLSDHASGSPCSMNAKHNWACPEQPSM